MGIHGCLIVLPQEVKEEESLQPIRKADFNSMHCGFGHEVCPAKAHILKVSSTAGSTTEKWLGLETLISSMNPSTEHS